MSVYFPCSSFNDSDYEEVWLHVNKVLKEKVNCTPVTCCDLDASLGCDKDTKLVVGKFVNSWINDQGRTSIFHLQ